VGTRYEDQPPEHWAGPESLDPTPVWKQFALIGVFLVVGLILLGGVALFAAAPQLVTPPALVPGDRLVLPLSALPPAGIGGAGAVPNRIGPPLIDEGRSFLLGRGIDRTELVAVRALWSPGLGEPECPVRYDVWPHPPVEPPTEGGGSPPNRPVEPLSPGYVARCGRTGRDYSFRDYSFDAGGRSRDGASRGLDRYLVSVTTDRVIVNLDRLIVSPEHVSATPTP